MTTTMHFGPEWMRTKHQPASRPQPPPSPPPASANNGQQNASTYSALVSSTPFSDPEKRDDTHPFRYSKEEMLRIYKEGGGKGGLGLEVERWEGVVREVGSDPIGLREMGEGERKLFTGSVNSEIRRRQSTDYLSPLTTPALGDRPKLSRDNSNPASPMRERFGSLMSRRRDSSDPPALIMPRRQSLSSGQGPLHSPRDAVPSPRSRVGHGPGFDGVLSGGDSWIARRKAAEALSRTTSSSRADPGSDTDTKAVEIKEEEEPDLGSIATMHQDLTDKSNGIQNYGDTPGDQAMQAVNQALGDLSLGSNNQHTHINGSIGTYSAIAHPPPPPPPPQTDLANVEWSYLDPQGNVQGPFIADVMQKWYDGGYFTSDLLMKRTHTDNDWIPVGELARRTGGGKIFLTPSIVPAAPPGLTRQAESPQLGYAQYDPNNYHNPYQPVPTRSLRTSTLDSYIAASSNSSPSSSFGAGRFSNGSPDPTFGGGSGGNMYPVDNRFSQASGQPYAAHRALFQDQAMDPTLGRPGGYGNIAPGRASSVDTYGFNNGYSPSAQSPWSNNFHPGGTGFDGIGRSVESFGTYPLNQAYPMNAPAQFAPYNATNINDHTPMDVLNESSANTTIPNDTVIQPPQTPVTQDIANAESVGPGAENSIVESKLGEDGVLSRQQYTDSPTLHHATAPAHARQPITQQSLVQPPSDTPSPIRNAPSRSSSTNLPSSPWATVEPVPTRRVGPFDAAHPKATNVINTNPATPSSASPWGQVSATSQPTSQTADVSPWFQASLGGTTNDSWVEQKPGPNSLTVDNLGVHNQQQEIALAEAPVGPSETVQPPLLSQLQTEVIGEFIPPSTSAATVIPSISAKSKKKGSVQSQPTLVTQPPAPAPALAPAKESTPPPTQTKLAWATEEDKKLTSAGLGLREIQEAEAKKLEARKAAERERAARLAAASVPPAAEDPQPFTTASWGLPTSRVGARTDPVKEVTPAIGSSQPTNGAVWTNTGKPIQSKKTMKEIQEEEERRKKTATKETVAAAAARRGYADTTNKSTPSAQPTGGAWTTVGTTGKPSVSTATAARPAIVSAANSPVPAPAPAPAPRANGASAPRPPVVPKPATRVDDAAVTPSHEFLQWLGGSLKGLNTSVNLEDIVSMLLSFPLDPDPSTVEIITELIYANSTTLDGRRFASEFVSKRKADAASRRGVSVPGKPVSIADVVRTQPKPTQPEWGGFKVVNKKKKGGRA